MVNIKRFESVDILAFMGDQHGNWRGSIFKITQQYKMENSITFFFR